MNDEVFLGILKPEEEKLVGQKLDSFVDWTKVFKWKLVGIGAEAVDGKLFTGVIKAVDDRYLDKLPEDYKAAARDVIVSLLDEDWEELVEAVPVLLNIPINIPGLDEDTEAAILLGICQGIYAAILAKANKEISKE